MVVVGEPAGTVPDGVDCLGAGSTTVVVVAATRWCTSVVVVVDGAPTGGGASAGVAAAGPPSETAGIMDVVVERPPAGAGPATDTSTALSGPLRRAAAVTLTGSTSANAPTTPM